MDFDEFQNYAPLYVIGALEPAEIKNFEEGLEKFGEKAKHLVRHCHALHESLALSVRPRRSLVTLKKRVLSRVRSKLLAEGETGSYRNGESKELGDGSKCG